MGYYTDLLGLGLESAPQGILQPTLRAPLWNLEPKGPKEGDKHQEKLHLSQLVPWAYSVYWKQREKSEGGSYPFVCHTTTLTHDP